MSSICRYSLTAMCFAFLAGLLLWSLTLRTPASIHGLAPSPAASESRIVADILGGMPG